MKCIIAFAALMLLRASSWGSEVITLKMGDPAPKLQTGAWVQGEPVKAFQNGKAYLVEFWATWCGPCRVSIPHLNELHTKYKDKGLVVIGQDCFERDDKLVAPFVQKMGEKMTYRVALDDKTEDSKGKMAQTWMAAAGRNGIPSAFLVDTKGTVAWIGHPMQLKEKAIEAVLAGTFDIKKASEENELRQKNNVKLMPIFTEFERALDNKEWDKANAKLEEAAALLPEDEKDSLDNGRLEIALRKKDYPAADKLITRVSDANPQNAIVQNELAWRLLADDKLEPRELKLAETIALRANEISKGKEPAILDTLARAQFLLGKKEQAIDSETKALALADGEIKASLEKNLESYKKGEVPKRD